MVVPLPIPVTPPDGSSSTDSTYVLDAQLLLYLSNAGKSKLLSSSNIGASTTAVIQKALEKVDTLTDYTAFLIDETILDGLANNGQTSAISVSNTGDSANVRIIIILGDIQPTPGGKVSITDGTTNYELEVSVASSVKRLEFTAIPAAFVSNFYVTNLTGVSFASWGNSVLVVGL